MLGGEPVVDGHHDRAQVVREPVRGRVVHVAAAQHPAAAVEEHHEGVRRPRRGTVRPHRHAAGLAQLGRPRRGSPGLAHLRDEPGAGLGDGAVEHLRLVGPPVEQGTDAGVEGGLGGGLGRGTHPGQPRRVQDHLSGSSRPIG